MDVDISSFIKQHRLPDSYQATAKKWFLPLAQQLSQFSRALNRPLVIGINGSQGSGKSTLSDLLVYLFQQQYDQKAIALSIDDFYLTRQQRFHLAETVHPLLMTRGVPGTHDVDLAIHVINQLTEKAYPVSIPRFNKAIDDRHEQPDRLNDEVDIIILEGWCVGVTPQTDAELHPAVNTLEQIEDPGGIWRHYVNQQLADGYQRLFALIDTLVMLKAPSFDSVFHWRLEQEEKLRHSTQLNQADQHHVMSPAQIGRFIQFYQRITEHAIVTLPQQTHCHYHLDTHRQIQSVHTRPNLSCQQCLVFTDLDGTLLDHDTYQFDAALQTLSLLEHHAIPVIPVSSKTQAEIEALQTELHNTHPFISENGAAVFLPKEAFPTQPEGTMDQDPYWVKAFVAPRKKWQELLQRNADPFQNQFISFAEAGIDGIIEMTGLSREAATLAGQRQYGEPVKWLGDKDKKEQFIQILKEQGANVLEGGRFIHISGQSDKGLALKWLAEQYQRQHTRPITTIALGDSHNDVAMLNQADHAVLIPSPAHDLPHLTQHTDPYIPKAMGPSGWAEAISYLLALH